MKKCEKVIKHNNCKINPDEVLLSKRLFVSVQLVNPAHILEAFILSLVLSPLSAFACYRQKRVQPHSGKLCLPQMYQVQ